MVGVLVLGMVEIVEKAEDRQKHRLNTLHLQKANTMATNEPSRIESMRQYNPTILWVYLVAVSIFPSMLVLVLNTSWDNTGWNWGKILSIPIISLASAVFVMLIALALLGYFFKWDWTGVRGYTPPNKEYQRGKTLWDWLQLLLIPLLIAAGGWLFNIQQDNRNEELKKIEINNADKRYNTDIRNTNNQLLDNILQKYLDNMQDLIVNHNLRNSGDNDPIRDVARGQTLVAIQRLDPDDPNARSNWRKARLLQFLHEVKLINKDHPIIHMYEAWLDGTDMIATRSDLDHDDLSLLALTKANLSNVNMKGIGLSCTGLSQTNLSYAYLDYADLRGASLVNAKLINADLRGAKLTDRICGPGIRINDQGSTDLRGADLSGADLNGAILDGADLHGTQYNAKVMQWKDKFGNLTTDEQGNPITLPRTQWPEGFDPKARGAICVDYKKP